MRTEFARLSAETARRAMADRVVGYASMLGGFITALVGSVFLFNSISTVRSERFEAMGKESADTDSVIYQRNSGEFAPAEMVDLSCVDVALGRIYAGLYLLVFTHLPF